MGIFDDAYQRKAASSFELEVSAIQQVLSRWCLALQQRQLAVRALNSRLGVGAYVEYDRCSYSINMMRKKRSE